MEPRPNQYPRPWSGIRYRPVMVKAGHGANCRCWPTCQPVRAAIRRLTSTWPRAVGQRPLIRSWAHTPLRHTSGTDVVYCG